MSKTVNQCLIIGSVGKDPEVRTLDSGTKVAQFSVATSTGGYKKQDGTDVPEVTQWHNIVAWRNIADVAEKYIHKGDKIVVQGMITYREYEAKDKTKRYATEIVASDLVLCGVKGQQQTSTQTAQPVNAAASAQKDDDLPF